MSAKSGHPDIAVGLTILEASLSLMLVAFVAGALGVRVNTSSSLPLGLYVRTQSESATLIEFCPAEPFASISRTRGYRTRGFACPDGAVPLLKPIIAKEGDTVVVSPQGVAVNGRLLPKTKPMTADAAGRPLTPWPDGTHRVARGTVWVASTYNRGSYDSRYMGPIDIRHIRRRLRPLWLLNG
jgi:conjugative transfer signal peptidase TraF